MGRGRAKAKLATPMRELAGAALVAVPAVTGLTVPEALMVAGPFGLSLVSVSGEPPLALTGLITAQRPAPGTTAPPGTALTIWTTGPDGPDGPSPSLVS